ncbi:hypothetical protein CEP52_013824 [Fusarium oligoseptatum]|uniref:Uncharacterized protein n=1 Tax=Fusarium oligoseptatum TaxID=2604345 RepID=A0A428SRK7_9HYPO|nr:hypothetical protein CEP52_013824 [Fusarium oligoseptatum]
MPVTPGLTNDEYFRGIHISHIAQNTSQKFPWQPGDRVFFSKHAARYQMTGRSDISLGLDEVVRELGITNQSEYYKNAVLTKVKSALLYLVTDKFRQEETRVLIKPSDDIRVITDTPLFLRDDDDSDDNDDDDDGATFSDDSDQTILPSRRHSTRPAKKQPASRPGSSISEFVQQELKAQQNKMDQKFQIPSDAPQTRSRELLSEALKYATVEVQHNFHAAVAGMAGDLREQFEQQCGAKFARTKRDEFAQKALEAELDEMEGMGGVNQQSARVPAILRKLMGWSHNGSAQ